MAYCADLKSTWQRPARVCCTCSGEHPLHHPNWHHTSATIVTFVWKYTLCLLFANILTDKLNGKSQDYRVCFDVFDNYQQVHFQSITLFVYRKQKNASFLWHCYWKFVLRITKQNFWGPKVLKVFRGRIRLDFRRLLGPVFNPPRRETAGHVTCWPCLWRNWKVDNLGITGSETGL